jgi:hypothetical protein
MGGRMRHGDYGSKEKLFSIDKDIFCLESRSWRDGLGPSLTT